MSKEQQTSKPPTEDSVMTTNADQGYQSRSRSASRRRRRQNQRHRGTSAKAMASLPEEKYMKNPATQDTTETQPFEHIKPPSQSMDGPVTYSRMMRSEIPWRGPPPSQPYDTTQGVDAKIKGPDPMEQDGLKLRIQLNLDIEIELKAHIHGDITLALLA